MGLAEQFPSFSNEFAYLPSLPECLFGVGSVLQRILVALWGAGSLGAAMHATALLAAHCRRTTAGTHPRSCPAAGASQHRGGIAFVGNPCFGL